MLVRNPAYWLSALLLSGLGILVFGLFFSNPAGPRLGIVDDAQNAASARLISSAEALDAVNVLIDDREEQLQKLEDGERWAVVVLPPDFGEDPLLAGVEIWTTDNDDFTSLTGVGIIRQLLVEAVRSAESTGIVVVEAPVDGQGSDRFIDVVLPGQVGLSLMFGNLFAASMLAWWRYFGILKRLAAAPVSPLQLIASQLIVFGALSAIQATMLITAGSLAFGVPIRGSLFLIALIVAAGVLALLALWYTLVALLRSPIAVNSVATLTAFVMMIAGSSYLPIEDPPVFLQPLVVAAPLTHFNSALRSVINDGDGISEVSLELAVLGAWTAGLLLVSVRAFRWSTDD